MEAPRSRAVSASRAAAVVALLTSSACIYQGRLAPMPQRGLPLITEGGGPSRDGEAPVADEAAPGGVRHLVRPGETLWRIARAYSIPVADLQRANGLSDPSQLEAGTRLLVPGADRERTVPPADAPQARLEPRPGHRASPAQIPTYWVPSVACSACTESAPYVRHVTVAPATTASGSLLSL